MELSHELGQDEVDARFLGIVTDLVGAPTELVSAEGELVWHARRSLWGASQEPAPIPLRFPGQYADDETGLFYNLQRYYDPETGRYVSQDPLGLAPAPNPSAYVDNPTTTVDPLGLAPCDPGPLSEEYQNSYFDVGDEWNKIIDRGDDPWALNKAFLDDRIAAGDRMLLSVPKNDIRPGSYLEEEIGYLRKQENGYEWVNQWALKPRG